MLRSGMSTGQSKSSSCFNSATLLVSGEIPMAATDLGTIRIASLADAPDLASVHVASWRETYVGMVPAGMLSSLSVDGRAAMWAQIMREPATSSSTAVYLAEFDRKIVGFGSCGSQRAETLKERGYDGEISAIYVLKAFQRHAIGTRLLFALAYDLSARGFGAASLWVLRDNAPARRFYERYGAQVIAEREDVRRDGVLLEVAYGWTHLAELARITARK
jgi:ribosomal protein S18 acetylase RimI-like enzyme